MSEIITEDEWPFIEPEYVNYFLAIAQGLDGRVLSPLRVQSFIFSIMLRPALDRAHSFVQ